jgi:hypothetical protein
MDLTGLEPATSWVRSLRSRDSQGSNGMVKSFTWPLNGGISPRFPSSTHHKLTTSAEAVVYDSNALLDTRTGPATSWTLHWGRPTTWLKLTTLLGQD